MDVPVELPAPCRHMMKKGFCYFGEKCQFRHEGVEMVQKHGEKDEKEGQRKKVKNSSKCAVFRRWLLDTYGRDCLIQGSGILDVAGGKGELSFELLNLSSIPCTIIDPRPLNLVHFKKRLELGVYSRNAAFDVYNTRKFADIQQTGSFDPNHIRLFFESYMWEKSLTESDRLLKHQDNIKNSKSSLWTEKGLITSDEPLQYNFRQLEKQQKTQKNLQTTNQETNEQEVKPLEVNPIPTPIETVDGKLVSDEWSVLSTFFASCSIVIGMHPDQAAGAIVDFAISRNIPFALTPCCVYSELFPHRRLKNGKPLKSYTDLIQFLIEKDPENITTATLDFQGKNVVVYWKPKTVANI